MKYLVLLLLSSFTAYAQLPQVRFEHLTSKDGLPSNDVLSVVEDKDGFAWLGTRKYLTRYDGYDFQNFTQIEGLYNHGISVDDKNNIWVNSRTIPLGRIDNKTLKVNDISPKFPDLVEGNFGNIFFDSQKKGWMSDFHGVFRFDPTSLAYDYFALPNTTYKDIKADFIEDKQKNLWIIGLDVGIYKYDSLKKRIRCVIGKESEDPAKRIFF